MARNIVQTLLVTGITKHKRNCWGNKLAYAVNPNICQGCGACAKTCPTGAIKVEDGKAIIDQTLCNQCGACVTVCPYGAIFRDLSEIQGPEPVKEGYGEGSFVVIRAKKISY
jgi:ferredoxin